MINRLGGTGASGDEVPSWAMEEFDGDLEKQEEKDEAASTSKDMEIFFTKVEDIKQTITSISQATKTIGEINDQALHATAQAEEDELSNKLRPLVQSTNNRGKQAKVLLEELRNENTRKKIKPNDLRIRENLVNTLTRKFVDEMKDYQQAQQKYRLDIKAKVTRQVHIVKPDATPEEIDAVMKSEGGRDALFKEKILTGVADPIKSTYAKVAGKYQDVLTLESSVAELHQMFQDFALLTEKQGELLDQIEFQVRSAADYVEEGNVAIVKAIDHQKSVRKKQCWIMAIVVIVLVGILFGSGII